MMDAWIPEVLRHIHPPVGFRPWHGGPSTLGALRGVSADVAGWKPYPDRHSIWELALHIAYWNYAVWRRLTDADEGGFPRSPSNWPTVPIEASQAAWAEDRRLVREWHDRLAESLEAFDPSRLDQAAGDGSKTTFADLITGVLLHDTYHTGQIQIMKRLAASHGL